MNVVIRAANQKDYEAVCALFAQVDQVYAQVLPEVFQPFEGPARPWEFFAQILANEEAAIFVAEHQDALVGLIHCSMRSTPALPLFVPRDFVYLEDLVVSAAFQHHGIGHMLMERVHQWAREKGVTEVELDVWEFNASARILYEKQGYQTTRRVMRKHLP